MPPGTVKPIILDEYIDEGGVRWVQLRLADGRTGWIRSWAAELDEQAVGELARALLARLATAAPLA